MCQCPFDAIDIGLAFLGKAEIDNTSYFGRMFAKSESADGIEMINLAILRKTDGNIIEEMACTSGQDVSFIKSQVPKNQSLSLKKH